MNWFGWLRSLPQIKHYHYSKLGTPFEETTLAAVTLQGRYRAGLLFEGVGDEHKHLLPLVEEQHEAEVAHPLLRVPRGRDELKALHLGEMGGVAEHVDEHELGHVPVPERWLILADSRAYRRALTPHHRALLRRRFARAYRAYHIPAGQLTKRGYSIGTHERYRSGAGWGEFWGGRGFSPEACAGGEGTHSDVRGKVLDDLLDRIHADISERTRRRARRRRGEQRDLTPRWLGREAAEGEACACRARWTNGSLAGSGDWMEMVVLEGGMCEFCSFVFCFCWAYIWIDEF